MGEATKETVLDVAGCKGLAELHEQIRQTFGFPAHYGANLDALWDMGRDYIGSTDGQPVRVRITGTDTLSPELRSYFTERVMRVLRDIAREKDGLQFILQEETP